MKPMTTSIYTFETLREGGFLYVDKTSGLYGLIERPGQYFLARPRRFGKSLLVSTLKAIFQGRRDLFDGLAICDRDYDWKTYPVIHLDMGAMASANPAELRHNLLRGVSRAAEENHCSLSADSEAYQVFEDLISDLSKRDGKVVILIDEYDKPLLGHLGKKSAGEMQSVLKQFYSVVKATEPYQRFVLLTGVSKFSKVSVFSDLNNLTDLTMSLQAATLLGYTQEEVEGNFFESIAGLANGMGVSSEQALADLRTWYNGYKFHQDAPTVYNPVSLMKCLINLDFKNYWFETGTPTFLLELLKRNPVDLGELTAFEEDFSEYEAEHLSALPLLFQTGYLTIRGATRIGNLRQYQLGFPNLEVETSFSQALASSFANLRDNEASSALAHLVRALQRGDVDTMLEHLKTFFAQVPYELIEAREREKYYQTIFFTVFKLIGAMIEAEVRTNRGRIDAVVKTDGHIFIFEFKLHGTEEEALGQIHEKKYAAPYDDDPRRKLLVGVAFSPETRNLGKWIVEGWGSGEVLKF